MATLEPLYIDVYAAAVDRGAQSRALRHCRHARRVAGVPTMIHVSCADMTIEEARVLLNSAQAEGVTNLIIERGAPIAAAGTANAGPTSSLRPRFHAAAGGFRHAAELVAWVRATYGDYFSVGVAGFPVGAGEYDTLAEDDDAMRDKTAAGAHFILAQHVVSANDYTSYVGRLRALGVTLPVIASVLLLQDVVTFERINSFCGIVLPRELHDRLDALRNDVCGARALVNGAMVEVCRKMIVAGAPALHVITLNLETESRSLLAELRLAGPGVMPRRRLPWRPSGDAARSSEAVRPVFWALRPESYVERTSTWSQYPSGRWIVDASYGVSNPQVHVPHVESMSSDDASKDGGTSNELRQPQTSSAEIPPAGGAFLVTATAPQGRRAFQPPPQEVACGADDARARRTMWGETLYGPEDVAEVFARFVEGGTGGVTRLPWCDAGLHPETSSIAKQLAALNRAGFLTINSQPSVNGSCSDDDVVGWGGPGGYVYQKAYVEFFCDPAHLAAIMRTAARHSSVTFQAVDAAGNTYSNSTVTGAQAITWGVFPGREVAQPTVVDLESFIAWKVEAFTLWRERWGAIYDDDSKAREVIADIHDTYFLVNVVDHDFVIGDIMKFFMDAMQELRSS